MEFVCSLYALDKKITVTWYKNSTVCREITSFDGKTARLTISSCKTSHAATYKVVFKNSFGEVESSARLVVNEVYCPSFRFAIIPLLYPFSNSGEIR